MTDCTLVAEDMPWPSNLTKKLKQLNRWGKCRFPTFLVSWRQACSPNQTSIIHFMCLVRMKIERWVWITSPFSLPPQRTISLLVLFPAQPNKDERNKMIWCRAKRNQLFLKVVHFHENWWCLASSPHISSVYFTFKHAEFPRRSVGNWRIATTELLMIKLSSNLTCKQSGANLATQDDILIYLPANKSTCHACMHARSVNHSSSSPALWNPLLWII